MTNAKMIPKDVITLRFASIISVATTVTAKSVRSWKATSAKTCSDDTHNYNAVTKDCVNKSHGFDCVCKNGYELVNGICILIGCEQGDYEFNCKAGFEGDGFTCNCPSDTSLVNRACVADPDPFEPNPCAADEICVDEGGVGTCKPKPDWIKNIYEMGSCSCYSVCNHK